MPTSLSWFVALGLAALIATARPIAVHGDTVNDTLWLWAWQHGSVSFNNSVTGAPVRIGFGLTTGFDRFEMITDEKTENYYTSGSYDIGQRLTGQRTRELEYCSVVGINVQLGSHHYQVTDSCLQIKALWPPV